MKRTIISRLIGCALVVCTQFAATSVWSGPVARELAQRGDNVGFPKPRPMRRSPVQRDIPNLANPLDADIQVPIRQRRVARQVVAKPEVTTPKPAQPKIEPKELAAPLPVANRPPSACLKQLLEIAIAESVASPHTDDPACLIPDPVNLKSTQSPYPIQFTRNLTLDCPFALVLARFVNDTTQALARHHLATAIKRIDSGEGYVCRRRNNAATGKLSEHAFGNATDWIGFRLADGTNLPISDASLLDLGQANFLNSVRSSACGAFTTVLGPGANEAHATHFHFDLGRSKDRKNPYRICE